MEHELIVCIKNNVDPDLDLHCFPNRVYIIFDIVTQTVCLLVGLQINVRN